LTTTHTVRISQLGHALLRRRAVERKQKDELCGPFWVALSVATLTGQSATQDDAALAAGTLLTAGGGEPGDRPPGESSRLDYVREIAATTDTRVAGTSPRGLVRAVTALSGGALTAVPIAGPWQAGVLDELTDQVTGAEGGWDAVAVLNVATRYLWNTHVGLVDAADYLDGGEDTRPPSEWQVGHYIGIVGALLGRRRRLVLCADTYPSLGQDGLHVQPADRLAAGLTRPQESTSGGAIVVIATDEADAVRSWAADRSLIVDLWDNGSADRPDEDTATPEGVRA
jgi:hypothetical protein